MPSKGSTSTRPPEVLKHHFKKIPLSVLKACADHFKLDISKGEGAKALLDANCHEVLRRGVEELFFYLAKTTPEEQATLIRSCGMTLSDLKEEMLEILWASIHWRDRETLTLFARTLEIPDRSPLAICEQILLNGLDAYLEDLKENSRLQPVLVAFGVSLAAEDCVELVIDTIFPPRPPGSLVVPMSPAPSQGTPKKRGRPSTKRGEASASTPVQGTLSKAARDVAVSSTSVTPRGTKGSVSTGTLPKKVKKEIPSKAPRDVAVSSTSVVAPATKAPVPKGTAAPSKKVKKEPIEFAVSVASSAAAPMSREERNQQLKDSRPPLEKGITLGDLQNFYWITELRKFCLSKGLKPSGRKACVMRMVSDFLNGDTPNPSKKRPALEGQEGGESKRKKGSAKGFDAASDSGH